MSETHFGDRGIDQLYTKHISGIGVFVLKRVSGIGVLIGCVYKTRFRDRGIDGLCMKRVSGIGVLIWVFLPCVLCSPPFPPLP